MNKQDDNLDAISTQAAVWAARRDGGLNPNELAEFDRWCAEDPRREEAVAEIEAAWSAFDRPRATGSVELLRSELRALARRSKLRLVLGVSTALAAACFFVVLWLQRPAARPVASTPSVPVMVDASNHQVLPDGSVVELRPGSRIETDFSAGFRRVHLVQGEAYFDVAKNPARPFLVDAATVQVRAVGTIFNVRLGLENVEVVVTEGAVAVGRSASEKDPLPSSTAKPATTLVGAGNRLVVPVTAAAPTPAVVVPVSAAELDQQLAWCLPRLEFADTSIAEAIELFNRSNRVQLKAGDNAVSSLRVTGVFRADNVAGFVRLLEVGFRVRAERRGDSEIVLRSDQ